MTTSLTNKQIQELARLIDEKMIFNGGLKLKFLKENNDYSFETKVNIINNFAKISAIERRESKDLCFFTEEELSDLMLKFGSFNTVRSVSSYISKYLDYCSLNVNNARPPINIIKLLKNNGVYEQIKDIDIISGYVRNEEELNKFLNLLNNHRDRLVLYLLYEGFSDDEILNLKMNDVDFNSSRIYDKKLIYPNTLQILKNAIKEESYIDIRGRKLSYIDDSHVIRFVETNTRERTRQVIMHILRDYIKPHINKPNLTPNRIRESGLMNYLIKLEHIKKRELTTDDIKEALIRYNKNVTDTNISKYKTLLNDFKRLHKIDASKLEFYDNIIRNQELEKHNKNDTAYQDDFYSPWVDENLEQGKHGEEIVRNFLIKRYGKENVKKVKDFEGFDLELSTKNKKYQIEVKSIGKNLLFNLTINQIIKSNKYKDTYLLCLVCFDGRDNYKNILVISDPVNFLKIDMDFINKIMFTSTMKLRCEKFRIQLNKEIINNLVTLEKFIKRIN